MSIGLAGNPATSLAGMDPGRPGRGGGKICAELDDRDAARTIAALLSDVVEPAADALTLFEVPRVAGAVWRIEAYYSQVPDTEALSRTLAEVTGQAPPALATEMVPDLNWIAISQASLPPVHAGGYVVHGAHDRARVARGPRTIEIEAGEAFGTAHHATTAGCLDAIVRRLRARSVNRALDLGCGTGVLAIAMARMAPRARIDATDIDVTSVAIATANTRANGVAGRVRTRVLGGPPRRDRGRRYGLVVANILAGPLVKMAPRLARLPARGATLVLSGILVPQARQVIAAYRAAGCAVVDHRRLAGWSTIVLVTR